MSLAERKIPPILRPLNLIWIMPA